MKNKKLKQLREWLLQYFDTNDDALLGFMNKSLSELIEEPAEPELRGWIEVTAIDDKDEEYLYGFFLSRLSNIEKKGRDLYVVLIPSTPQNGITLGFGYKLRIKESYDEIKQKIKEAS